MKRIMRCTVAAACTVLISVAPGQAQGILGWDEQIYDMGHVGIDFTIFHDFKLYNRGKSPIKIDSVQVSCDCSRMQISDSTIRPGDTTFLHLSFDTRNWYGPTSKAVVVRSNDVGNPRLELYYKSVVGQWPAGLKPDPISVFMLPAQKVRKLMLVNSQFKKYTLSVDMPKDTFYTVAITKPEVPRGNSTEIEVKASDRLAAGTYLSSFRVCARTEDMPDPVYLTIPVKIVRY